MLQKLLKGIFILLLGFSQNLFATTTTFTFDADDHNLATITKTVDGLTITLSNPTNGQFNSDNEGVYILVNFSPIINSLNISFSKAVKLISYNVGYTSSREMVITYSNGGSESVENSPFSRGSRNFANQMSVGEGSIIGVSVNDIAGNNYLQILNLVVTWNLNPEPSRQPTSLTATTNSTSQITTSWTDSVIGTEEQYPDSYLVMCSTTNSFSDPVDATAQSDDTSCSDGSGVQNISHGTGTVAWTGLSSGTQYFYKIFPYTNTGSDVDYKTDGTVATANATTQLQDTDATLTASSTIQEPVPLPSTADTTGEAVNLFDFTITDGGTSDRFSTDVSQIVLHTSGTSDFSKVTWRLNGANVSNGVGVYNSGANTLTFSGLAISVADGGSQTYTLSGYYSTPTGLTNNQTYIVSLDGDDDLTLSATGTQMSGSNAVVNNGTGTVVAITASKLMFQTLPSN